MKTKLIIAPTDEPVTLLDARKQCGLDADITDDDTLLAALIESARAHAEHMCQRAFLPQTWEVALDAWPCANRIALPMPNLISIVSVKYIDGAGAEQTLSASAYTLDDYGLVHGLQLKSGQSWPSIASDTVNPIKIRYTCGYADADSVPQVVKHWMLMRISWAYRNRDAYAESGFVEMPYVDRLLDAVRVPVL